jgi:DNA-binding MarR family transcriptional regulator
MTRSKPPSRATNVDARNEPLVLLHFAFRAVIKEADAQLEARGFGRVHHRILFFIARNPGLRVAELVATLGVTKQALHKPLQQLVGAKLVENRAEPSNLRAHRLSLTPSGAKLERRLSGQQRRLFSAAFRKAGPTAAAGWRTVMRELGGAVGRAD